MPVGTQNFQKKKRIIYEKNNVEVKKKVLPNFKIQRHINLNKIIVLERKYIRKKILLYNQFAKTKHIIITYI